MSGIDRETGAEIQLILGQIADGMLAPYKGAATIWSLLSSTDLVRYPAELEPFIGYASEIQDHPTDRAAYERLILEAAQELKQQGFRL